MRSAVILVRNQALLPGSTVPLLLWDAQNAHSSWQACQKKVAKIFSHRVSHQAWTVSVCVLLPMFRLWHFHQSLFCLRSLKHSMPDWPHVMLQQTFPVCFSIFLCLAFLRAWETQCESSPILGSLHLIQYQISHPFFVRKPTRLLFPEHWVTISREGDIWEIANFVFPNSPCSHLHSAHLYGFGWSYYLYSTALPIFFQCGVERGEATRWLGISRQCYCGYIKGQPFLPFIKKRTQKKTTEGRRMCSAHILISSLELEAASLDRQASNF